MLVIQISLFDLPILKKHRGDCWRCFNSLFHGQDETRLLCNVEPCLKINWRNSKKIELLERAFRCFEQAFFEVLHVAGKITRVTLPTSCISCSCRSCDRVWCLRDSWRGVSPSLSWTSNLALSRTRSYRKQKASYKLTWLLGYVEVVGKSTQKGELWTVIVPNMEQQRLANKRNK